MKYKHLLLGLFLTLAAGYYDKSLQIIHRGRRALACANRQGKRRHTDQASSVRFVESPPYSFYDWHNAPARQYVITLAGTLEFETRPGVKFILHPGEILIALDTTGTAHKWKLIGDAPWKRVYIAFEAVQPFNFIPDDVAVTG